jgi:general secretion pathway protein A
MLSNLQTDEEMLMQIMIVGQPELRKKINDPRLEQFAQRIAVSYHLSAMNRDETGQYIAHRLEKAGGNPELFTRDAVDKIFEVSCGIPRTINLLCDGCLVYTYAEGQHTVDEQIVEQVIEEKGGIGIITRKSTASPESVSERAQGPGSESRADACLNDKNTVREMLEGITRVENYFHQQKEAYLAYIREMNSRADFCRDARILDLKNALAKERERNEKISLAFGRLQERYRLLLRKLREKNQVERWK